MVPCRTSQEHFLIGILGVVLSLEQFKVLCRTLKQSDKAQDTQLFKWPVTVSWFRNYLFSYKLTSCALGEPWKVLFTALHQSVPVWKGPAVGRLVLLVSLAEHFFAFVYFECWFSVRCSHAAVMMSYPSCSHSSLLQPAAPLECARYTSLITVLPSLPFLWSHEVIIAHYSHLAINFSRHYVLIHFSQNSRSSAQDEFQCLILKLKFPLSLYQF